MLIQPQYEGFYGAIERAGRGSVQTLFYHFVGFPLVPQETFWVTGHGMFGSELKVMKIRRSAPSIVTGYLRGWATAASLWTLGAGLFLAIVVTEPLFPQDPLFFGRTILGVVLVAIGLVGAFVALVVWLLTRRAPSDDELARRAVFQGLLGHPCDPALLDDPWSQRDDLKRHMLSITEAMGLGRDFDGWSTVLGRGDVPLPPSFLRMAMTVARLERAAPAERTSVAALPAIEEQAWQRLVAIEPAARAARPS